MQGGKMIKEIETNKSVYITAIICITIVGLGLMSYVYLVNQVKLSGNIECGGDVNSGDIDLDLRGGFEQNTKEFYPRTIIFNGIDNMRYGLNCKIKLDVEGNSNNRIIYLLSKER